jgi:hypothetical protein
MKRLYRDIADATNAADRSDRVNVFHGSAVNPPG